MPEFPEYPRPASYLAKRGVQVEYWENRHDKVYLFEGYLAERPAIRIDNREIVEARSVTLAEAQGLNVALPLRHYLKHKKARI